MTNDTIQPTNAERTLAPAPRIETWIDDRSPSRDTRGTVSRAPIS
jgi:hypothetical protein